MKHLRQAVRSRFLPVANLFGIAMIVVLAAMGANFWHGKKIEAHDLRVWSSYYDASQRVVLPIESFGANWRVRNFRKNVLFPDGFDNAADRAMDAVRKYPRGTNVLVTFAPERTYRMRRDHAWAPLDASMTFGIGGTLMIMSGSTAAFGFSSWILAPEITGSTLNFNGGIRTTENGPMLSFEGLRL